MKKILKFVSLVTILFFMSILSFPQIRESGTIHGNVYDEQGEPLPGVKIIISGANLLGGAKTYISDKNGYYRFPSFPPGPYIVSAEIPGFVKVVREGIILHANMSLTVDFKMTQSKVKEEVLVIGELPTIDVKSSVTGGVVLTDDMITSLPGEKHFSAVVGFAPGVMLPSQGIAGTRQEPNALGMGGWGTNAYQLDGVNATAPDLGDFEYSPDFNALAEVSVQSFGLPAEYGNYVGVILTGVTKSGSNKFSSFNEIRYNGKKWNSQNRMGYPEEEFASKSYRRDDLSTGTYFDTGLQLGGKIIQDKLWFFLSTEYDITQEFPSGTDVIRKRMLPRGFVKLTYQLNPSNRFNVAVHYEHTKIENAEASRYTPPEADYDYENPGWLCNTSWTSIFSPVSLLEVKFGFNSFSTSRRPRQGRDVAGHYDYVTRGYTYNYPYWWDDKNRVIQGSAHFNNYFPDFLLGSHDLKVGAEIEAYRTVKYHAYAGNEMYYDYNGPYRKFTQPPVTNDLFFRDITVFVQDTWSPTKRLTFNLGVRFDAYWFNIPAPDRGDIYNNQFLAPRLGLTFDLLGDRKNVFKIYYGHSYSSLRSNIFGYADTRIGETTYYRWNGTEYAFDYSTDYVFGKYLLVDPDLKHPYVREISGGYERELFRDASLSINFFYKKLVNAVGFLNLVSEYEKRTYTNPGPDGVEGTSDDLGTFDAYYKLNRSEIGYLLTNPRKGQNEYMFDDPSQVSKGIQIIFQKRYSNRWQLMVSYQYASVKGNNIGTSTGLGEDPNSFYNSYGKLGWYAQPHQFKLVGNVLLPLDINVGVVAQVLSGGFKYAEFTLYLPSTTYFNGVPPGEAGRYATDKNLDLRLEKKFRIRGVTITALADIFNVFNSDRISSTYDRYGSYYDMIYTIESPRRYRIGLRIVY